MPLLKHSIPLGIIYLLGLISSVKAQDDSDTSQWPEWVTNDYDCVIGCLSGFNDTITTIPQADLESAAYGCSSSTCTGDSTGNYYQILYYIQLFYATGSIYEWSDSAPDGYKHATFTSSEATSDAAVSGSSDDSNDGSDSADSTDSSTDSADVSASATDSSSPEGTGSADGDSGAAETGAVDVAESSSTGASTSSKQSSSASGSASSSAKTGTSSPSSTVAADQSEGTSSAGTKVGIAVGVQGVLAVAVAVAAGGLWTGL
ncbi:hypothetical protein L198_00152 [Cryptococcus wingfieldii CBS 7118]|uniref:Cell wall protein n=1 Tax=Cryptococcus wingfieldii CBS 7118 TaxID=1295528 RepID=A0A1E3K871_9TREE|nr:hypothetical protein L198_00152 [Cryptococcus wingfieldii CBS 7118]ODO08422.1 hypothetical protein L198_00152 [Cryptococcus wingfieldii CBS 7118]